MAGDPQTSSYDPAAEVVELCRDLIRIDTSNYGTDDGPGERKAAEHVAALLDEHVVQDGREQLGVAGQRVRARSMGGGVGDRLRAVRGAERDLARGTDWCHVQPPELARGSAGDGAGVLRPARLWPL